MRFVVCEDVFEIASLVANEFLKGVRESTNTNFNVALSGGSTPRHLFLELTKRAQIHSEDEKLLSKVNWFFSDERYVNHADERSNFKSANDFLFSPLRISSDRIFAVPTDKESVGSAAQIYEDTIKRALTNHSEAPQFDLVFLGMGSDGHTASLFPNTDLVKQFLSELPPDALVASSSHGGEERVTFTPALINNAKKVILMVAGEGKAATLKKVLEEDPDPLCLPVQLIDPVPKDLVWVFDRPAAKELSTGFWN